MIPFSIHCCFCWFIGIDSSTIRNRSSYEPEVYTGSTGKQVVGVPHFRTRRHHLSWWLELLTKKLKPWLTKKTLKLISHSFLWGYRRFAFKFLFVLGIYHVQTYSCSKQPPFSTFHSPSVAAQSSLGDMSRCPGFQEPRVHGVLSGNFHYN